MKKFLCECGCGEKTNISNKTDNQKGWIKGQPVRFVSGHNSRKKVRYVVLENGCWVWQLFIGKGGYGKTSKNRESMGAHRYYYKKYKGKIPKGLELDHLCRNRACVNPDHLEPVTAAENIRRGNSAKLNWDKVDEIRGLYKTGNYTQEQLAKKFLICQQNITKIVKNKTWIIERPLPELH